jgi:hypothetical protein
MLARERERVMRRIHRLGLSDRAMGRYLGLWSQTGVRKMRLRLGLPANNPPPYER